MKQIGLIKRVIEALGLDDGLVKGKHTPSESKPLIKDLDGEAASRAFSYSSVVGMPLYLSGHTRPDIAFAVNCCARYMFNPRHLHELALKRLGRYLKQTPDRGMVMNVSQWTTIRLMLILECILGLCSKQGDITCAFLHVSLGKEAVYIEMPQGFKQYDQEWQAQGPTVWSPPISMRLLVISH
jgi:hypothetical protein